MINIKMKNVTMERHQMQNAGMKMLESKVLRLEKC
jgi:hypothetical protein